MSGDTEVAEVAVSNGSKMASETEHPKVNGGGIAAREEEKQEQEEEEENAAELSEQDKKILSQMQKIDTALQVTLATFGQFRSPCDIMSSMFCLSCY